MQFNKKILNPPISETQFVRIKKGADICKLNGKTHKFSAYSAPYYGEG